MIAAPLSYLHSDGAAAAPLTTLAWGLGLISIAVIVIIGVLLALAVYRRRNLEALGENGHYPVRRTGSGLAWIYIGLAISIPVLAICTVWTLAVLAQVVSPSSHPTMTIEVTAHRWWWEVRYLDDDPARVFTTANEIHLPTGTPVRVLLSSQDVIHSFWVPKLAGKMDVVPGLTNVTWLQADAAGEYRGQCGEFCGAQHAKMAVVVFADSPSDFRQWWGRQLSMSAMATGGSGDGGAEVFISRCSACHTIRGTPAGGISGPDLTHFATRSTIAAVTLLNDSAHLTAWIRDPQAIKPGTLMPQVPMSAAERRAVVAYLESVK